MASAINFSFVRVSAWKFKTKLETGIIRYDEIHRFHAIDVIAACGKCGRAAASRKMNKMLRGNRLFESDFVRFSCGNKKTENNFVQNCKRLPLCKPPQVRTRCGNGCNCWWQSSAGAFACRYVAIPLTSVRSLQIPYFSASHGCAAAFPAARFRCVVSGYQLKHRCWDRMVTGWIL